MEVNVLSSHIDDWSTVRWSLMEASCCITLFGQYDCRGKKKARGWVNASRQTLLLLLQSKPSTSRRLWYDKNVSQKKEKYHLWIQISTFISQTQTRQIKCRAVLRVQRHVTNGYHKINTSEYVGIGVEYRLLGPQKIPCTTNHTPRADQFLTALSPEGSLRRPHIEKSHSK